MVSRPLGKTGLAVSPIALGTTKLGRNTDVKYKQTFELPSDAEVDELLEHSLRLGVNLIDTAPAYGESERRLGKFIALYRDKFLLCTKCGEQYKNGKSTYDFSTTAIASSVENSLRCLRTDHLDILLLHSNGQDTEILTDTDAPETLYRLKKIGNVRTIGISAKTPAGILAASEILDVVMAPFSQKDPSLGDALKKARERGIGVLAIKGLYSGHLDAQAAIEFVLGHSFIDALVLGTINPQHLRTAVAAAERVLR